MRAASIGEAAAATGTQQCQRVRSERLQSARSAVTRSSDDVLDDEDVYVAL